FSLPLPRAPRATLFPYTTLFRSHEGAQPELLRAWLFRIVRNSAIDEQRGVRHYEQLDENYDGVEQPPQALARRERIAALMVDTRSEEHTSELQSLAYLVCRLLLE